MEVAKLKENVLRAMVVVGLLVLIVLGVMVQDYVLELANPVMVTAG